jgi:hypothetical protein
MVYAEPLVDLFGLGSKGKWVPRVMSQATPTACAFYIDRKVLSAHAWGDLSGDGTCVNETSRTWKNAFVENVSVRAISSEFG